MIDLSRRGDIGKALGMLIIFSIINLYFFFNAAYKVEDQQDLHPAFWNASDGQRYWGVGLSLSEGLGFVINSSESVALKRAGPIPALVFSLPIKMVGFDQAAGLIVTFQCILLIGIGALTAKLAMPYGVSPFLVGSLIIFNPNLITLAHHAQSDLLFVFVLTVVLVGVKSILESLGDVPISTYIGLGVIMGVMPLTRPFRPLYRGGHPLPSVNFSVRD